MKTIIQQVEYAKLKCWENEKKEKLLLESNIGEGIVVFVGFGKLDTFENIDKFVEKLNKWRIFKTEEGKIGGDIKSKEILLISNFTLYGNLKKGTKSDFGESMKYEQAKIMFDKLVEKAKNEFYLVKNSYFGAYMEIDLKFIGPISYFLEV